MTDRTRTILETVICYLDNEAYESLDYDYILKDLLGKGVVSAEAIAEYDRTAERAWAFLEKARATAQVHWQEMPDKISPEGSRAAGAAYREECRPAEWAYQQARTEAFLKAVEG